MHASSNSLTHGAKPFPEPVSDELVPEGMGSAWNK